MSSNRQYERMTIYVDDRDSVQRRLTRLELEHDAVLRSDKSELYQAIVETGLAHEEELLERLREESEGDDSDE